MSIERLKEELEIYKGISEGKSIIISKLEAELKQYRKVNQQLTDKIIELNG